MTSSSSTALLNATFLKAHSTILRPYGPQSEITFDSTGSIGMHIVQSDSRVLVACAASASQAEHKTHFADQILRVNDTDCTQLTMRQVKALIVDSDRPLRVVLQPLGIEGKEFPLIPPMNPALNADRPLRAVSGSEGRELSLIPPIDSAPNAGRGIDGKEFPSISRKNPARESVSEELWGVISRAWTLESVGAERVVVPETRPKCVEPFPDVVIVVEDGEGVRAGERVVRVEDGVSFGRPVMKAIRDAKFPGAAIVVQKVRATGVIECMRCQGEIWKASRFCPRCGARLKATVPW